MAFVSMKENFDNTGYPFGKVADMGDGKNLTIHGRLQVAAKPTKNGGTFLRCSVTDSMHQSTSQLVFEKDSRYDFLKDYVGKDVEADVSIACIQNAAYMNMDIHNVVVTVPDPVDQETLDSSMQNKELQLMEMIDNIVSPFIRDTVKAVFSAPNVMQKILSLPATEHSGYNYHGGLADLILSTANLSRVIADSINVDHTYEGSLSVNPDLLLAGALLCNVGKVHMYKWEEGMTKIVKTDSGVLYNELSLAHDMVSSAMRGLMTQVDVNGDPVYTVRKDVPLEILHMVDSCKSQTSWGALSVPRTKHALILSSICQMVFAKGLFESFEKNNPGERFLKAYDGGKTYFMPEDYLDM